MTQLLIWVLVAYGMSNILVYGKIFNKQRDWIHKQADSSNIFQSSIFGFISELISCMMCVSVWTGFFLSFTYFSPSFVLLDANYYYSIFIDGMLASGAVWAINAIVEWFEENRPNTNHL